MAACGSLQHMFENALPESPTTLAESPYAWNQIKPVKPIEQSSSFTEIFGELHFKDNSSSVSSSLVPMASSSSSRLTDLEPIINIQEEKDKKSPPYSTISMKDSFSSLAETKYGISCHRNSSDSFSSLMNSESLQLCTEGLGFESSGEVEEDMTTKDKDKHSIVIKDDCKLQKQQHKLTTTTSRSIYNINGSSSSGSAGTRTFPPPISCISKNGKPWVCFKSYRHDGRFVLKQIQIPTQEFLHACREDGRLKLHFVHPHHRYDGILEDRDQQYDHEDHEEEEGGDHSDEENGKEEGNIDETELVPVS